MSTYNTTQDMTLKSMLMACLQWMRPVALMFTTARLIQAM